MLELLGGLWELMSGWRFFLCLCIGLSLAFALESSGLEDSIKLVSEILLLIAWGAGGMFWQYKAKGNLFG
jgi:hypothetical protein